MKRVIKPFLAVLSALLVVLSHPIHHPLIAYSASTVLIGLFFYAIAEESSRRRFFWGMLWYGFAIGCSFSWFATTTYHGPFIVVAYVLLLLLISAQFGFLCLLVQKGRMQSLRLLMIAAVWALLEWTRLFILSGFSLHPLGVALSWHPLPLQMASLFGVYGLSFFVVWTNLLFARFLVTLRYRSLSHFVAAALIPYLVGAFIFTNDAAGKNSSVAIIQTGMSIEEKNIIAGRQNHFIDPLSQWEDHFRLMKEAMSGSVDYIVFPEAVSMFAAYDPIFPFNVMEHSMVDSFGPKIRDYFPSHSKFYTRYGNDLFVSNAFVAQTLSNFYSARLIIGLELYEGKVNYNAALHFVPFGGEPEVYHKQVLLPVAEYLPFRFLQKLASKYGIAGFFTPGKGGQIFHGDIDILPSICYDECFGHKMVFSGGRPKMLVSLSNDGWFPNSDLPWQHLLHGRIRATEMGIPMLRSCNTGVSAVIDSFGRITKIMEEKESDGSLKKGVLLAEVKMVSHKTLYSLGGDFLILALCALIITLELARQKITIEQKSKFI